MDRRSEQVARNATFQSGELRRLQKDLSDLDESIAEIEKAVVLQSNEVSAARALVAARGGELPERSRPLRCAKRAKQRVWQKDDGSIVRYDRGTFPHPTVRLRPQGMVYTDFRKRYEAPRQSGLAHAASAEAKVVLTEIEDISRHAIGVGTKLWLLYWFDRNDGLWRLRVRPPRMRNDRVGVFASRSPNRPSPVGLSMCVVHAIHTVPKSPFPMVLTVSGVDILDESPLFTVRPFSPHESFPSARCGWIDFRKGVRPLYYDASDDENQEKSSSDTEGFSDTSRQQDDMFSAEDITIQLHDVAAQKILFIQARTVVDVEDLARVSLRRAFRAYASKSVGDRGKETGSLAVGAFRVVYKFVLEQRMVVITDIVSGMRREVCDAEAEVDPEAHLHLQFQLHCHQNAFRDDS